MMPFSDMQFSVVCIFSEGVVFIYDSSTFPSFPTRNLTPLWVLSPVLLPHTPLSMKPLLSVSMNLPVLVISNKENHTICSLLCHLAWFQGSFMMCIKTSFLFVSNDSPLYRHLIVFIHSSIHGHLDCFLGVFVWWVLLLWMTLLWTFVDKFLWAGPLYKELLYIPTSNLAIFQFLYILTIFVIICFMTALLECRRWRSAVPAEHFPTVW